MKQKHWESSDIVQKIQGMFVHVPLPFLRDYKDHELFKFIKNSNTKNFFQLAFVRDWKIEVNFGIIFGIWAQNKF